MKVLQYLFDHLWDALTFLGTTSLAIVAFVQIRRDRSRIVGYGELIVVDKVEPKTGHPLQLKLRLVVNSVGTRPIAFLRAAVTFRRTKLTFAPDAWELGKPTPNGETKELTYAIIDAGTYSDLKAFTRLATDGKPWTFPRRIFNHILVRSGTGEEVYYRRHLFGPPRKWKWFEDNMKRILKRRRG